MDLVSLLTTTTSKGNPNAWNISKAYYNAGADAFDILGGKAFYSNVSFSVAGEDTTPTGLFFKPDGTKMYVVGDAGNDVNEYTLSTPWLVSSASYVQNFSVGTEDTSPQDIFFKPDGTKMYIVGDQGDDVNEYSLSSAWDISTASYVQNFSVSTQDTTPTGLFFKPDGTKMYVLGQAGLDVNEYSLSSAWDISTASYVQNFSVSGQEATPTSLSFSTDGTKMYVLGETSDRVQLYNLSSAWDISTASHPSPGFSVTAQETVPRGLYFNPDGSGFYVVGNTNDRVYQYAIGGFSVAAQETEPRAVFFKPDGTKMYVCGITGDDVNEYNLSTAWDTATASYVQVFSISAQELNPSDIFFKPDGTRMYVSGKSGQDINEYSLSSAWDISSASYVQNFSVSAQETAPEGLFFKPDGTKMYVAGDTGDDVNEYSLSSAWDISTASYVQNFSVSTQLTLPLGLFFKSDGTKMYLNDTTIIYEYSLSSAWNISTASFNQSKTMIPSLTMRNLYWRDDGEQLFTVSSGADKVFSFSISPE